MSTSVATKTKTDYIDTGGGGGLPGSYAAKVAGIPSGSRKKLNILDIMLERKDNSVNFNLSKEELSKLLFKKLKVDPKDVLKIDRSAFGKILVEFTKNVDPEHFVTLPAFDIRDGLRTKYYKPHHRKEALVTVSWMDIETPDELLVHVLSHFGKVKSNVIWSKIKEEEGDTDLAKLLNNINSGERQIWMEITKPLPSYAVIDKRRVKIFHPGQRRTCARCQQVADLCNGNSNAKLCEDNGGVKVNVATAWKDTLAMVNYIEWSGGEVDVEITEQNIDDEGCIEEEAIDITNCDGVVISNLDEDVVIEDIKTIIKTAVPNDVLDKITVHPTGSTRSKIVKDFDVTLVKNITKKVNSKSFKGRLLHCRPHVPVTPPKNGSDTIEDNLANESKKEDLEENVATAQNIIPGLPQKEIEKARKKQADKKKKEEKKKKRKQSEDIAPLNSTSANDNLSKGFVFEDESDEDTSEDSVEEFMTPGNLKSNVAKKVEKYEVHNTTKQTTKRAATFAEISPVEPTTDYKKKRAAVNTRSFSLTRV